MVSNGRDKHDRYPIPPGVIPANAGIQRMMKRPTVYIMANDRNGTLYVGVTTELVVRVHQHREGLIEGFTKRYGLMRLVYFEWHVDLPTAIRREKLLKRW